MPIPITNTAVFFAYDIYMNNRQIGTLSRFAITSDMTVERVREVSNATGRPVQLIPGITNINASVEKFRIYKANLFEAMGFSIVTLEDLIDTFDVVEILQHPNGSTEIITYHECLASNYGKTVTTGTSYVAETATIQISYATGTSPNVAQTGQNTIA